MRKLFLFLLPAAVLLAGCGPKQPDEPLSLTIDPELITCPDAGGDYTVTVISPNGEWSATPSDSWIRVNPASGGQGSTEVRIRIDTNKESAETQGKITFVSGEEKVEMPVSRAAKAAPYLRVVSEKELNTPKEGGSYTVQVESNIKWQIASNTGWAKVDKGVSVNNDRITVTVSPATTPEETSACIVVSPYGEGYEAGKDTVFITRGSTEATSLTVEPTAVKAPEKGGTFTVQVSSNARWRVYKTWDMDWLTLNGPAEGDGNGSFGFSIEAATSLDAVSGILTIEEVRSDNYKPVVAQVAVSREGKAAAELSVSPTTITAEHRGGSFPIEIKSNYPWTASIVGAKYFSVSTTSGDGDATMIVTVKPTTEREDATGSITIRSSYGNEQAKINIRRLGHTSGLIIHELYDYDSHTDILTDSYTGTSYDLYAPYTGTMYTVVIISDDAPWEATLEGDDFVSVDPTQCPYPGYCISSMSIVVPKNVTYHDHLGRIIIKSSTTGEQVVIKIYQPKYPFWVPDDPYFLADDNEPVYFSPGNLQYQASTETRRFAEHQWDYIGENNIYKSSSYDGWIDLFDWGTGDRPYYHNGYSNEWSKWWYDYTMFEDWFDREEYPISNDTTNERWFTLSYSEWLYLLQDCENGFATVNNVHGLVLLPVNWSGVNGLSFTPTKNIYYGITDRTESEDYTTNVYTLNEWTKMEQKGAVFLPAAGSLLGSDDDDELFYIDGGDVGGYWSKTPVAVIDADYLSFDGSSHTILMTFGQRNAGHSVRLVRRAHRY